MKTLALVLVLLFASPSQAGLRDRLDQRRIGVAVRKIHQQGIPADANGMAHTRSLRLNWIPFAPPFGAHVIFGRAVAFRVAESRQLYEPRISRLWGGGVSAGIGAGVPFSGSLVNEIRSFRGTEYEAFTERRHVQASVKLFSAAVAPGIIRVKAIGPQRGSFPGRVESRRELFVGLFAQVGVEASVRVLAPRWRR